MSFKILKLCNITEERETEVKVGTVELQINVSSKQEILVAKRVFKS